MTVTPSHVLSARKIEPTEGQTDLFADLIPEAEPTGACAAPSTCTDHDPCSPCLAEARAAGLTPAGDPTPEETDR